MWIEINFSGVLNHLSVLLEEKRKLLILKETVEKCRDIEDINMLKLQEAIDGIDRLIRIADRKYLYLEDMVREFSNMKREAASELDDLYHLLNEYLDIE